MALGKLSALQKQTNLQDLQQSSARGGRSVPLPASLLAAANSAPTDPTRRFGANYSNIGIDSRGRTIGTNRQTGKTFNLDILGGKSMGSRPTLSKESLAWGALSLPTGVGSGNMTGVEKLRRLRNAGIDDGRRGGNTAGGFTFGSGNRDIETSQFANNTGPQAPTDLSKIERVGQAGFGSSENPLVGDKFKGQKGLLPPTRQTPDEKAAQQFLPEVENIGRKEGEAANQNFEAFKSTILSGANATVSGGTLDGPVTRNIVVSIDPEIAELQKRLAQAGIFKDRELQAILSKKIEELIQKKYQESDTFKSFQEGQPDRRTEQQKELDDVFEKIDIRSRDIGASLSDRQSFIFDELEKFLTFKEDEEDDEVDNFATQFTSQQDVLNEQKTAQEEANEIKREEAKQKSKDESEKRLKKAKARFASRLTTDASGNLDAEAIALLDTIEREAADQLTKENRGIDVRFDSALSTINAQFLQSQSAMNSQARQFAFTADQNRMNREAAIDKIIKQEELKGGKSGLKFFSTKEGLVQVDKDGNAKLVDVEGAGNEKATEEDFENLLSKTPTFYGLPTRLVDSELEREKFEKTIEAGIRAGKTRFEIRDAFLGFVINKPEDKEFSDVLLNQLLTVDDATPQDFSSIARLINRGQRDRAITRIEKKLLKEVPKGVEGKGYFDQTLNQANRVQDLLTQVPDNLLGQWDARAGKWSTKLDISQVPVAQQKAFTALNSATKALFNEWTTRNAGTAKTEPELVFLDDILAQTTLPREIFNTKINEFVNSSVIGYNALRSTVGLPDINRQTFGDKEGLQRLYEQQAQTTQSVLQPEEETELQELERLEADEKKKITGNFLQDAEGGFKGKAFEDAGRFSIGFGTPSFKGEVITEEEGQNRFSERIGEVDLKINELFSGLTPPQKEALQSFVFNLGTNIFDEKLHPEAQRLRKAIQDGDEKVVREEFVKFNKSQGEVLNGLTQRRQSELNLFFG